MQAKWLVYGITAAVLIAMFAAVRYESILAFSAMISLMLAGFAAMIRYPHPTDRVW